MSPFRTNVPSLLAATLLAISFATEPGAAQTLLPGGDFVVELRGNDFQCVLQNYGDICSTYDHGGFWPAGSPNRYVYSSGIQLAGIVEHQTGNPWSGDTVGAYFYDISDIQTVTEPITDIWVSTDTDDRAAWPDRQIPQFPWLSAFVEDADLFNDRLLGRAAASDQDSWQIYWDGNPSITHGRDHPMGLLVEQRTLAWNHPYGNEGTLYLVWQITNITDNQYFQRKSEEYFFGGANALPDGGWMFRDVYFGYAADMDVTVATSRNFTTPILPFDMMVSYDADFAAADFQYFPWLFHPPFLEDAPGMVGSMFLSTPGTTAAPDGPGLTMSSVFTGGGPFPADRGTQQLWRYLSMNLRPDLGDPGCNIAGGAPQDRRTCWLPPTYRDVKYFQSSGPFSLPPGETRTVVMAIFAAPIVAGSGVVQGSFANAPPNTPTEPSIHPGCHGAAITTIERAAGWVSTETCPASASADVEPEHVETVEASLLFKAQVALAMVENGFLTSAPPEPPPFSLLPGENQVTVLWEPSPSESSPDPYAVLATDPASPLYDPNYRVDDVEGYHIHRSTDGVHFERVATFDKRGTQLIDRTCATRLQPSWEPCTDTVAVPLDRRVVQYPPGAVYRAANGYLVVQEADTVEVWDSGVPYAWVDTQVRSGFDYWYRVTAFDVQSVRSAPASQESESLPAQKVVPHRPGAGYVGSDSIDADVFVILGDGTPIGGQPQPTIDAQGRFSGPAAPTAALSATFEPLVPQLLNAASGPIVVARLDSIVPAYYGGTYWFSDAFGTDIPLSGLTAPNLSPSTWDDVFTVALPADSARLDSLRAQGASLGGAAGQADVTLEYENPQWHSGDADWAPLVPGFWLDPLPASATAGGSRWFTGVNESRSHPTLGYRHGQLSGVDSIFSPQPYSGLPSYAGYNGDLMRRFYQVTWPVRRAADIEVRWGAAGTAPEVFDVTHRLPLPFSTHVRASWGFRRDADGDGVVTWGDFWRIPGFVGIDWAGLTDVPLATTPALGPVDVDGDLIADGTGFALYIAGEPYIFRTPAIPTNITWTLRTHAGVVTAAGPAGPYQWTGPHNEPDTINIVATPGVPGLRVAVDVTRDQVFFADAMDLSEIRVVPDPYYGRSAYDVSPAERQLRFMNLPPQASIRIYTVAGTLVDVINHESPTYGGVASWNLANRTGLLVASGVYFYHVSTPEGREHTGRFTVITTGYRYDSSGPLN